MGENLMLLNEPTAREMLRLLAASLNGDKAFRAEPSLWPDIRDELKAHAVLPLVSDIMVGSDISEQDKVELFKNTASNVRAFHKLMGAQASVIELLESHNIRVAVLKGGAAAQYYDRPELRQFGDIDILVPPDECEAAAKLLSASGCTTGHDRHSVLRTRHIGFETSDGIKLELHLFFSSSTDAKQNALLDGWLYDSLADIRHVDLKGYVIPALPPLENGLTLLEHINHHLAVGLGLRQIIDWMLYVRAVLTDEFWYNSFRERAEAIGLDYLAKVVTKLCQRHLGLSSDITWCADAEDELADELLVYILRSGNFGKKTARDSRITTALARQLTDPVKTFRYLVNNGCYNMEKAGLKPIKAVAWIYQIGHLALKTIRRENKASMVQEMQKGIMTADMFKRLKVTRL